MVVVEEYLGGRFLLQTMFLTSFVPQLMAVSLDKRCLNAIHHYTAFIRQNCQNLRDDFFQTAAVTTDEDGIGAGERRDVGLEKIADVDVDARGTEATGVLLDDGLALRSDLETAYLQMRELQTGLDGDAARAETDVPEHLSGSQFEGLEGQQADGHLGNHLLAAVE